MTPVLLAKGLTLDLAVGEYPAMLMAAKYLNNGALALFFVSDDGLGEPLCKASLNIEPVSDKLPFNQFVCKSYSENEGLEEYLLDSGIAEDTGQYCTAGHTGGWILQLNAELSAILQESLNAQAH